MKVKIAKAAGAAAKVIITAAVLVSFIFIGWRVWTKSAYTAHEKAACRAMAASAALCAADAAAYDPAVALLVKELKSVEYISDHKKMPKNLNVRVSMSSDGKDIAIHSLVSSGWNSRSPQSAEFSAVLDESGKIICGPGENAEDARIVTEARSKAKAEKSDEHLFTFPHERPCPAPFTAKSASVSCFGEEKVWILFFERQ